MRRLPLMYVLAVGLLAASGLIATAGERGALPEERLSQAEIARGDVEAREIRRQGLIVFSTPFNKLDGFGDGPNGRPTMGGNGTLLRVNGLDAQSCLECHSVVRSGEMPPVLGVGGAGGSNANAIVRPSRIGVIDAGGGATDFDGRFANPPFLFGAGGVELVGLEMTRDLQRLKARAIANPGTTVELVSKGVHFGEITADAAGNVDTTNVTGVKPDLIVRPFGRKGEFATVRAFDIGAMDFHFGMQPAEVVGVGVDDDQDGIADEITAGDLSALHVFSTSLERPYMERLTRAAKRGFATFRAIGCVGCHRPSLETESRMLPLRLPEVEADPAANTYYRVDLSRKAPGFARNRQGGVTVPLFSDLRRHDMGERLRENFHEADAEENRTFITARLWGVADSAPYLHDGRATTLTEAILAHGGEAQVVRDRFDALDEGAQDELLAFLRSLRTPKSPAQDVIASMRSHDGGRGAARGKSGTGRKSQKSHKSHKSHKSGKRYERERRKRIKHDWRRVVKQRKAGTWWPRLFERCFGDRG